MTTTFGAFHGSLATLVLCVLLFLEETGVPLPLAPGDLVLVSAGVLLGSHAMSPWSFIPVAILAATAGALVGHSWARLLGATRLRALAERLRMTGGLDRVEHRLRHAGPGGILVARLIPGMRVNTTLLAGALGVPRKVFVVGLIPAVVLWVGAATGLGVVAGVPVEHFLGAVDQLALQGAELLLVGLAGFFAARYAPARPGGGAALLDAPGWQRVVLALAIDFATVASIVAGIDVICREVLHLGDIDDVLDTAAIIGVTLVAYIVATRRGPGVTPGEGLLRVSYRSRPRPRASESSAAATR